MDPDIAEKYHHVTAHACECIHAWIFVEDLMHNLAMSKQFADIIN
jgi:hypothetical protein